jgi:hypothetical protein
MFTHQYALSRVGFIGGDLNEEMLSRVGIIYAHWHRYAITTTSG